MLNPLVTHWKNTVTFSLFTFCSFGSVVDVSINSDIRDLFLSTWRKAPDAGLFVTDRRGKGVLIDLGVGETQYPAIVVRESCCDQSIRSSTPAVAPIEGIDAVPNV